MVAEVRDRRRVAESRRDGASARRISVRVPRTDRRYRRPNQTRCDAEINERARHVFLAEPAEKSTRFTRHRARSRQGRQSPVIPSVRSVVDTQANSPLAVATRPATGQPCGLLARGHRVGINRGACDHVLTLRESRDEGGHPTRRSVEPSHRAGPWLRGRDQRRVRCWRSRRARHWRDRGHERGWWRVGGSWIDVTAEHQEHRAERIGITLRCPDRAGREVSAIAVALR
jgi:hypothetical protein